MARTEILRYHWKSKRRSLLYFSIGLFLWGVWMTAMFPTVSKMEAVSEYWSQFPDTLKNLFGGHEVNILKPDGYLTLEYYQLVLPIILTAFALGFAAFCVAKARENGTIELIFAHPVERWKYALHSFFSLSSALLLLSLVTVGAVMGTSVVLGVGISYTGHLKLLLLVFLFGLSMGSIALLASCSLRSAGQVYAVGIAVFGLSYLVNFLSVNWGFFSFFNHALLFRYYDPYATITGGGFPWSSLVYYLALTVALAAASMYVLQRRDVAP
jgi:ABC-2 type transport system permease protein